MGFTDTEADAGADHRYKIGSLDPVGREILLGPFEYAAAGAPLPIRLALDHDGPNPVRGAARLTYSLPRPTDLRVGIYSVSGRLVRTLVEGRARAGDQANRVAWRLERAEQPSPGKDEP